MPTKRLTVTQAIETDSSSTCVHCNNTPHSKTTVLLYSLVNIMTTQLTLNHYIKLYKIFLPYCKCLVYCKPKSIYTTHLESNTLLFVAYHLATQEFLLKYAERFVLLFKKFSVVIFFCFCLNWSVSFSALFVF